MAFITEAAKLPWEEKPTPRSGRMQIKRLASGMDGSSDNFEFDLFRFHPGYTSPRHRHNYEQIRLGISGSMTYDPGKKNAGSLVYFPEGADHGPQDTSDISEILQLSYGGSSSQGYMSQVQLIEATAQLAKTGKFENGKYSYVDSDGKAHSKDAIEACYEHVFKQPRTYLNPRIPAAIEFILDAHPWMQTPSTGIFEKFLAVLTERRVEARLVEARATGEFQLDEDRRQLVYGLAGTLECAGTRYAAQTSIFSDKNETTNLHLMEGWRGLIIHLPR